jgi:penicillin-binding protein 1A
VVASGTGGRAKVGGYDLAGKTGTTSDYRDAWFVGFTGGFVAAVWVGRDDNTPMKRVTGGAAPAEIWKSFMAPVLPHIRAEAIPGGAPPAPAQPDVIGNLIDGAANAAPAPEAPIPDEAPQPGGPQPQLNPDNPTQGAAPPF